MYKESISNVKICVITFYKEIQHKSVHTIEIIRYSHKLTSKFSFKMFATLSRQIIEKLEHRSSVTFQPLTGDKTS